MVKKNIIENLADVLPFSKRSSLIAIAGLSLGAVILGLSALGSCSCKAEELRTLSNYNNSSCYNSLSLETVVYRSK